MRTMVRGNVVARLAGALIAGGGILSLASAASAAPAGGAVGGAMSVAGSSVEPVQYRSGHCAELRQACLYKRQLGEVGAGNCSRYRAECGGAGYNSYSGYRSYRPSYQGYRAYRPSNPYWRYRRGLWD